MIWQRGANLPKRWTWPKRSSRRFRRRWPSNGRPTFTARGPGSSKSEPQTRRCRSVPLTEAEARQHWRQAGSLWRKLADLRIATRHYQEDLRNAADDFRRGHGFEQAVSVYRELLQQEPQHGEAEALVGLGESLLALGKTGEALVVLDHCRETYPSIR